MREIKHDGKTAYITEAERKMLLARFDKKKIMLKQINVLCCLCVKYYCMGCSKCPLGIFKKRDVGCRVLIDSLFQGHSFVDLVISKFNVYILSADTGIESLDKIYNALKNLPKVNRKKEQSWK